MTVIAKPGDTSVASSNDTLIDEPSNDIHTLGFPPGYKPPAQWINALYKRLHLWKEFLFQGTHGQLLSHGKTSCNAPQAAANSGGAGGSWFITVAAIDRVILTDCVYYDLPSVQLSCAHVVAADKLVGSGGHTAIKGGKFYYAYLSKNVGGTPLYYIRSTGPTGLFDTVSPDGTALPGRFLFRFWADSQGTIGGVFASTVGTPIPFTKVGRKVSYLWDDSTDANLTIDGAFNSGTLAAIDASRLIPLGCVRATIYVTGTNRYVTLGSNGTNVGKIYPIDEGLDIVVEFNTIANSEFWMLTTGNVAVYVSEYDDLVDGV